MKKKLMILTQSFPPETGAAANRIGLMADVLSKHYGILIVALKPSYPSSQEYEGVSV